jgi:2-polyprenyl-3-methyl-5-hydroxy-6-metoxy-1,4-benzoquinol methylase
MNGAFDPTLYATLVRIEHTHFWFQARNEVITWLVRSHAADAKQVLEIGCGTGFLLNALRAACPSAIIGGSDIHVAGLCLARHRHGSAVELIQSDARRPCLRDAFDLVCALDVLEHIKEDEAVLSGIRVALRPDGVLIASVPQHPWLWSQSDELGGHLRRYRRGEIEGKVRAAGLEVCFADSFVSLLLPAMTVSRLSERIRPAGRRRRERGKVPDDPVAREFRVGPVLNRCMRAVLRIEHMCRQAGLRFPIGGSRIVVARKPPQAAP